MCGIGGFYGFHNPEYLKQMSLSMEHRGPDGEGIFTNNSVSLLNRRLAIIDREGGNQPIYNETKSIAVVYNGEIYNYLELRAQLEAAGHGFITKSDTEVIVHGYEEWGMACFDKLNGMFGIALYDSKDDSVILVRDHFGIKPLYFTVLPNNQLIFASEIKPLLLHPDVIKKPNETILSRYLQYRIHDDTRETFFEGIQRLLPGEYMHIKNGQREISTYTSLQDEILSIKKIEYSPANQALFREKLVNAVKRRLVSEVPVGTCLSGGLDSSIIVSVVNSLLRDHVKEAASIGTTQKAYSAVFPGSGNDEEAYVDEVIKNLQNIDSIKIKPTPEEFFTDLTDFVRTQEEPTVSTGPYAQYQVMKRAKQDVTVLLDGQGADEMMAGYLPYYNVYRKELLKTGQYGLFLSELWHSKDIFWVLLKLKLPYLFGIKAKVSVKTLLKPKFLESASVPSYFPEQTNLAKRLREDIFRSSLQSLLRYEDKNAMRFSIEGRVPFLDFDVLKFLFSLPSKAIIWQGWNKYILRESMRSYIPEKIAKRRNKIGFTTPEHEWFMRMKNRIYYIFMSESFANRPYFNQKEVLAAFEAFIRGENDDTLVFWRILNVELWLREFFDPKLAKENVDSATPEAVQKQLGLLLKPNEGKQIPIEVESNIFKRYLIRTPLFARGDAFDEKIAEIVEAAVKSLNANSMKLKKLWYVIVSEKVVAISQGRSYFIWDITPGFFARELSKYVKKTPYGIGLGSPWTMQIAINEVGLIRILFASAVGMIGKVFGRSGLFYRIAGRTVASIDGPTEYSLYPSNVSAKLGPKEPQLAAKAIRSAITRHISDVDQANFGGVVIIDANDLGRDVLGNATERSDSFFEAVMQDNPMGQGSEQTPVLICVEE